MLHLWGAVEADFMRDYGINLMEQLDNMTWRRFVVLFSNLSPYGAVASRADEERKKMANEPDEQESLQNAAAFFGDIISTRKGRED